QIGDLEQGFAEADVVVEKEFKTAPVHQAYIEPHACAARVDADGQAEIWTTTQGHFGVRALTARLLGMPIGQVRVTASEIGGGFGGKIPVYLEPIAAALAKKTGRAVKIVMSRDEVFKATGPTSGASMWVKIGAKKDGTITAADGIFKFQAGAFPGSPVMNARLAPTTSRMCALLASTSSAIVRRRQPIARRARRFPPLRSKACSTYWPKGSVWTRCNCGSKTPRGRAPQ